MRLYRICNVKEIEAIRNGGMERLCFGGSLFYYLNLEEKKNYVNSYPCFKRMLKDVRDGDKEDRVKSILKTFPDIPKEIPLFEKDFQRRREIAYQFYPEKCIFYGKNKNIFQSWTNSEKINRMLENSGEESDEIFLVSIKVAGFFDKLDNIEIYYDMKSIWSDKEERILAIDFPDEVALQYRGQGVYGIENCGCLKDVNVDEYALPMYAIKPEHVVDDFNIYDDKWESFNRGRNL